MHDFHAMTSYSLTRAHGTKPCKTVYQAKNSVGVRRIGLCEKFNLRTGARLFKGKVYNLQKSWKCEEQGLQSQVHQALYMISNVMRRWDEETVEISLQNTFSKVLFVSAGFETYYYSSITSNRDNLILKNRRPPYI